MTQKISALQKALNLWAIILIVWSIYRANFGTALPAWFDELIAKPLVFILPVFYYVIVIEKKNFFEGIDFKLKYIKEDLFFGAAIALVFFFTGVVGFYAKFKTPFPPQIFHIQTPFLEILGLSIATAISEEILSRGFILKRLYEDSHNMFTAAFFASVLFFFLHVPILFTSNNIMGTLLLQVMLVEIILSLAISFIFLQRRSLLLPIIIHALYNISIYYFQINKP